MISNPNINTNYRATNIFLETKKRPTTREIVNLLVTSYENFFYNLNSYSFTNFKTKVDLMASN